MESIERDLPTWTKGVFDLRYELGDLRILSKTFHGVVCASHFLDLKDTQILDNPLGVLTEHGVEAAQVASCPMSPDSAKFSVRNGAIVYCTSTYEHYYVDARKTFDEYQDKFKSKTRATLRKKLGKFFQEGQASGSFQKFDTAEGIDRFLTYAGVVSPKTYQHRLFGRGLPDDSSFRHTAKSQASRGLARGYILFLADTPVAYTYVPTIGNRTVLYDYNGYDPACSKLSPGTVIQYKVIEDLCADPSIDVYDLCTGEDEAKVLFSTDSVHCGDIIVLRYSLKNIILVLLHLAVSLWSKWMGRMLERLNLKSRIKRLIRTKGSICGPSHMEQV
jgi:hypothetical protein